MDRGVERRAQAHALWRGGTVASGDRGEGRSAIGTDRAREYPTGRRAHATAMIDEGRQQARGRRQLRDGVHAAAIGKTHGRVAAGALGVGAG